MTNIIGDLKCIQGGYFPQNIIYSIPKVVSLGFEPWIIWLKDTSHYHLCQPMLVLTTFTNACPKNVNGTPREKYRVAAI